MKTIHDNIEGRTVRVTVGETQRTWGGWYRHDPVELLEPDGSWREIGRIQTRRRNGRVETHTAPKDVNSCVLGYDLRFLVRAA